MEIKEALTFDDVLLLPSYSEVLPSGVDTGTKLTKNIALNIPIISSSMDTVTESAMAISMAQSGGMGIIHKNLSIEEQQKEVKKVKKFEAGIVLDPITINTNASLQEALNLMQAHNISGIPVVEGTGKLVGILTNRDVRFAEDKRQPISELMTKNVITVKQGFAYVDAKKILHQERIEKLVVVNDDYKCVGLITVKDIEKAEKYPNAAKDAKGRLMVGASTGAGDLGVERAIALHEAGVDVIVIDTAHGHSRGVLDTIAKIKKQNANISIIGGNIVTREAAQALVDVGCDAVKVGIGPGSICTTRIIAGVGMPQLSAIMEVAEFTKKHNIKLIADGGIKYSGDLAKAIAAGADVVMIGGLLAGTEESPGEIVLYQGRSYKSYRGMGSLSSMARGSADRYFQGEVKEQLKLVPEGVEGLVPFKGSVNSVLHQLVGGLRAAMGYTGSMNISQMHTGCKFVRITSSGLKESHAHDILITREAPNYGTNS